MNQTAPIRVRFGEVDSILEELRVQYGYQFSGNRLAALRRLIQRTLAANKKKAKTTYLHLPVVTEILERVPTGRTSMFNNPSFYRAFRQKVVPFLRTFPSVRIWFVGCSAKEELYGLSILLREEGVARYKIYATDVSEARLKKASPGVFRLSALQTWEKNYRQSGGQQSLRAFYSAGESLGTLREDIRKNVVFFHHNLITDASFHEFQAIVCRNVLVHFEKSYLSRVHHLLHGSLCKFGVLGLSLRETLRGSPYENQYVELDRANKIYKRTG